MPELIRRRYEKREFSEGYGSSNLIFVLEMFVDSNVDSSWLSTD